MPKVGFFPGSTLGNFEPQEAAAFLRTAREILGDGAQMIIGVDLEKDERVLYDAYNDSAGVTARFNLNVLVRINRELGGNFDLPAFTHRSIYNRDRHRIEMHLISRKAQTVRILGNNFSFRAGREHPHREQLQVQPRTLHGAGARLGLEGAGVLDRRRSRCSRFTRWWLRTESLPRPSPSDTALPYRDQDQDRGGGDRQHQRRQIGWRTRQSTHERDDADAVRELQEAADSCA